MTNLFNIKSISRLLLIITFAFTETSFGAVIYVNKNAGGANNGTTWANAFNDLQDGLAVAVSGDEIWVRGVAVYLPDQGTGDRTRAFKLKSGVNIYGGFIGSETSISQRDFVAYPTILSGEIGSSSTVNDNSYTVVDGSSVSNCSLDGFYIFRGNANNFAGGAKGISGGGIYVLNGSPTFKNCTIRNNNAIGDGGGAFLSTSNATFYNCTFLDNTTDANGGAVRCFSNSTLFENCFFTSNFALNTSIGSGRGAGVSVSNCNVTFKNCVLRKNTGTQGPAIHGQHSSFGGPTNFVIILNNSTVVENRGLAPDGSASAVRISSALQNGTVKVSANSSIFYNNIANAVPVIHEKQISSTTISLPAELILNYCDVQGYIPGVYVGDVNNIGGNPLFIPDPNGAYHLNRMSPCENTGDPGVTAIPGVKDIDGEPRVHALIVDRGADEINPLVDSGIYPLKTDLFYDLNQVMTHHNDLVVEVFPNPSLSEELHVKYELYEATNMSINIITLNGQVIASINRHQDAGIYINTLTNYDIKLSKGIYLISFKTDHEFIVQRFVIAK